MYLRLCSSTDLWYSWLKLSIRSRRFLRFALIMWNAICGFTYPTRSAFDSNRLFFVNSWTICKAISIKFTLLTSLRQKFSPFWWLKLSHLRKFLTKWLIITAVHRNISKRGWKSLLGPSLPIDYSRCNQFALAWVEIALLGPKRTHLKIRFHGNGTTVP